MIKGLDEVNNRSILVWIIAGGQNIFDFRGTLSYKGWGYLS